MLSVTLYVDFMGNISFNPQQQTMRQVILLSSEHWGLESLSNMVQNMVEMEFGLGSSISRVLSLKQTVHCYLSSVFSHNIYLFLILNFKEYIDLQDVQRICCRMHFRINRLEGHLLPSQQKIFSFWIDVDRKGKGWELNFGASSQDTQNFI